MSDQPATSPSEKRAARDAAQNADEWNWVDEAAHAHPGPDFAVHYLYGLAKRLVDRLAAATGEGREQVLKDALR